QASDLQTVEDGCGLLAGLFEQCWDTLHPDLADYGIEGRKGACESLVRIGGFLAPLRRVPLIRHARLGSFSGADFVRYASEGSEATGYGQFRAAVADTPTEQLEGALNALARIRAAIERADIFLSEQAQTAGHTGTNFQPTYDALDELTGALRPFVSQPAEILAEPVAETESAPAAGTVAPGRVNSRADAARAIDAVIDYYLRAEPSSPIPVGLTRIKGWITMDFMAILNDIAPGSLSEAAGVLRTRGGGDASDLM
ncbi:MAG TPA: type VI secretion system ImpA family N-terminal domain-containing protein, partial [Sphingomicrobium sp.]